MIPVPRPKPLLCRISVPIVSDTGEWWIESISDGGVAINEPIRPNLKLREMLGERPCAYFKVLRDVEVSGGFRFIKRCDEHGRPIQHGWQSLSAR